MSSSCSFCSFRTKAIPISSRRCAFTCPMVVLNEDTYQLPLTLAVLFYAQYFCTDLAAMGSFCEPDCQRLVAAHMMAHTQVAFSTYQVIPGGTGC